MSEVRVKVKLTFPESEVRRAVLATLVRRFDVEPDIRRADVEEHRGWIVCEIDGRGGPGRGGAGLAAQRGHHGRPAGGRPRGLTASAPRRCRLRAARGSRGTCHPAEETLRGS